MDNSNTLRHWLVLVGCCVLCVFGFALPLLCFGVFVSPLVKHFGSSVTDVNLYFSFMTAAAVVSCSVGARLIERSLRGTVIGASALIAGAYALLSAFPSVPLVWVAGVVAGLCYPLCSSILVPIVINRWFARSQATFTGAAFALVGAAGVVAGPLLTSIIASVGWRPALAGMGACVFVACALAAIVLLRPDPAALGLVPFGWSGEGPAKKNREAAAVGPEYRSMIRSTAFVAMAAACVLSGFIGDYNTQVNTIAQKSGFDSLTAGLAFSCTSGGLFAGKILLGWVKDRFGGVHAVLLGCVAGAAAFTAVCAAIVTANPVLLYAGCALCGLCTCLGTIAPALLAGETFGKGAYAEAVAHATAFVNGGMAIGAPLYSMSFDVTGSYVPVLAACALATVATVTASAASVRLGTRLRERLG